MADHGRTSRNFFEINFSKYLGLKDQGVAVSSATAGLHLILMALDIRENDEVIIPGLTFGLRMPMLLAN